ncbi:hypothetical protein NDN08_005066 [Rhodosorus marinus]|uniref:Kinesin motor domain-containing protein n=1 Tax=Rhodosorus marinus TaxID=101924 RepID=A0AAV8V368_9RHOD|nr:hypothetical protein NDN08_005066 [Rhodosorus marinus]
MGSPSLRTPERGESGSMRDRGAEDSGNVSSEMHRYSVTLQTGDARWGGTDAQVYLTMVGDCRTTEEIPLTHGELLRGSVTEVAFSAPFVGNLLNITIRHDGKGWSASWALVKVTISDETLFRLWSFHSNKVNWLNHENNYSIKLIPVGGVGAGRNASRRRSNAFHKQPEEEEVDSPQTYRVLFKTNYLSNDDVTVYAVGAGVALGSWKEDSAIRMQKKTAQAPFEGLWKGDWELEVELDDVENIEYKYICIDDNSKKRCWESTTLRKVNLASEADRSVQIIDSIDRTPSRPEARKQLTMTPSRNRSAANGEYSIIESGIGTPVSRLRSFLKVLDEDEDSTETSSPGLCGLEGSIPHEEDIWESKSHRGRITELQSSLQAARKLARDKEREIAALRAKSMMKPAGGSSPSKDQIAIEGIREQIADVNLRLSSLKISVNQPITNLFDELDNVRMVVSDYVEFFEEERESSSEARRQLEFALQEARGLLDEAHTVGPENDGLQQELDSLRATLQEKLAALETVGQRLAEEEKLRREAEHRYAKEWSERKRLFNTVQELKGNIRVFCRIRPPKAGRQAFVDIGGLENGEYKKISVGAKRYEFDRVFGVSESQSTVYQETASVVTSVLDGYNACVFAYGQTGSGKTYTMNGVPEDRGVNFRALQDLFRISQERNDMFDTKISVSMVEIYNETLRDLLVNDKVQPKLEIKKGPDGVFIPDLTLVDCHTSNEVWNLMREGSSNRASGATAMNERSSRSHLIVSVRVQSRSLLTNLRTSGNLHLVDLAGSERLSKSHAVGDRLKEAAHINKSLAALGDVFMGILSRQPHIPFRNSKLTYLLQESIGGNSKTVMFVNVAPEESEQSETNCSLLFASRVAKVELGAASKRADNVELVRLGRELSEKESQRKTLETKVQRLRNQVLEGDRERENLDRQLAKKHEDLEKTRRAVESASQQVEHLQDENQKHLQKNAKSQEKLDKLENELRRVEAVQRTNLALKDEQIRALEKTVENFEEMKRSSAMKDEQIQSLGEELTNMEKAGRSSALKDEQIRVLEEKITNLERTSDSSAFKDKQILALEEQVTKLESTSRSFALKDEQIVALEEKLSHLERTTSSFPSKDEQIRALEEKLANFELTKVQDPSKKIIEMEADFNSREAELKLELMRAKKLNLHSGATLKGPSMSALRSPMPTKRVSTDAGIRTPSLPLRSADSKRERAGLAANGSGRNGLAKETGSHPPAWPLTENGVNIRSVRPMGVSAKDLDLNKRPKIMFDSEQELSNLLSDLPDADHSANLGSSLVSAKPHRSVHFAPEVSVASVAGKANEPPVTPMGAKRITYAFGSRVQVGEEATADQTQTASQGARPAINQAGARRHQTPSFSRPAQRVIAGGTPMSKAQRTARRFG